MPYSLSPFACSRPDEDHIEINPSVLYMGTPVALITSTNPDGSTNVSPMSSAWALFDRVILGLTSTSMGRENLVRERQLVINFPSADLWPQVEAIARATGRHPVPPHKQKTGYRFTAPGADFLQHLGVDIESMKPLARRHSGRVFCRPCLDWSERRPHIAGTVGAALCGAYFHQGWIRRIDGSRAVTITAQGHFALRKAFGPDVLP